MSCLGSRATVGVIGERVSGVPTRAELGANVGGIGDRVSGVQHMTVTGMFESEPLT